MTEQRIVKATRTINAPAAKIFELIADPARQPEWDGNDNLAVAPEGQRITAAGQEFTMELTNGQSRTNYVVEFEEGRRIAWNPAPTGEQPRGICSVGDSTPSMTRPPRLPILTTGPN